jgi:hypothetical protein
MSDDNINEALERDITDIIAENPTCEMYQSIFKAYLIILPVTKWFRSTPQLEAKQRKEREQRNKRKAGKKAAASKVKTPRTSHDLDRGDGDELDLLVGDTSDSDGDPSLDRPTKKARTTEITAYINVETPARTTKLKPTIDACGPFFFTLESTHDNFLTVLAKTIQPTAGIQSINQLKLFWKLNVPANDKQKPLGNPSGFRAMTTKLSELLAKNKDTTITLTLPPLLRVALQVSTH